MRTAIIAGAVTGALVSGYFIWREIQRMQTPAFERTATQRVTASAERAAAAHLGQVYGLTPDRIAAISTFARTMSG